MKLNRENAAGNANAKASAATRAAAKTPKMFFAAIAAAAILLFAFAAIAAPCAAADFEPAAVMSFSFKSASAASGAAAGATGSDSLKLESFKAGLIGQPQYIQPSSRDMEARVLDSALRPLYSYWFSDPRYTYYDYVENGELKGGKNFNPNALFYATVPILPEAQYAAIYDSSGKKLIAVNLLTGTVVEEKQWTEISPVPAEEKTGWTTEQIVLAAAAAAIAVLAILGLFVFRKASGNRKQNQG